MLVPSDIVADVIAILYYIMVADVIATRTMFHPFIATWQMLLPYDIVLDVKTTSLEFYITGVLSVDIFLPVVATETGAYGFSSVYL